MIQNLEGGIMADILVHEGDLVDKDQVLLRIDNTTAQSNYDDLHSPLFERHGRHHATCGGDRRRIGRRYRLSRRADAGCAGTCRRRAQECPAFGTSSSKLRVAVLHDQATQKEQEVEQLTSKIDNLKQSLALAQKTLNIMNSMEEGVVSQVDKLKAQRDVHDLKSELESRSCSCRRQSRPNRRPRTGSANRN